MLHQFRLTNCSGRGLQSQVHQHYLHKKWSVLYAIKKDQVIPDPFLTFNAKVFYAIFCNLWITRPIMRKWSLPRTNAIGGCL